MVVLVEIPAGAEPWGDEGHRWLPGVGGATTFTTVAPHTRFRIVTAGAFVPRLPGIVGGTAESASQLLCLFLGGRGQGPGTGAVGHKEPLWPVNEQLPGVTARGQSHPQRLLPRASSAAAPCHLSCLSHGTRLVPW